jgi:hypothetical protein
MRTTCFATAEPDLQEETMAYDQGLAERLREQFRDRRDVMGDTLMARVGPDSQAACLRRKHAREMDFTGKPMKGMVYVAPEGIASDVALADWVGVCTGFVATLPARKPK